MLSGCANTSVRRSASADPRPALPQDTGWNLFRKPCGPLVVYELTPLDKPHGLQCMTERL